MHSKSRNAWVQLGLGAAVASFLLACGGDTESTESRRTTAPPESEKSEPGFLEGLSDCSSQGAVNEGAQDGSLTISGIVRDSSGTPLVGVEVALGGDPSARRFSTFDGSFLFRVNPGSYRIVVPDTSGCLLYTGGEELELSDSDLALELSAVGPDCVTSEVGDHTNDGSRTFTLSDEVYTLLAVSEYSSEAEVIRRIQQGTDVSETSCVQGIAGLSAVESTFLYESMAPGSLGGGTFQTLSVTTALALGTTLMTFDSRMDPDVPEETVNLVLAAARNLTAEQIEQLMEPPE